MSNLEILLSSEATGQMWNICLWDPQTGSTLKTYKGHASKAKTTGFVSNTFLVSAQPTKPLLNVWNLNKHEQKPLKYITPGNLHSLSPSPCGHYLVGTADERIYLWQTCNGKLLKLLNNGHYQRINVVKFTPDSSQFVTAGEDGNVIVWFLNNSQPRFCWSHHSLGVTDLVIGHGDSGLTARVFTASKDQTAKVYCLNSGQMLLDIEFNSMLTSLAVDSAEESGFVGTKEGVIQSFSLKSAPRDLKLSESEGAGNTFKGHSSAVTCLSVSMDGQVLASGSEDCNVKLWHIKSRQCIRVLPHKGAITTLFFMLPKRGMLVPEDFQADRTLSLLEKTVMDKSVIHSDLFSLDIICNENDKNQVKELSARAFLTSGSGSESFKATHTDEVDHDQVKHLKSINHKLYEAAAKAILKE